MTSGAGAGGGPAAPSTRAIVRNWNVAMATATKVIGALRASGLVETIPAARPSCDAETSLLP